MNNENNDYGGSDELTREDFADIKDNYEVILDGLYGKVRNSDQARAWLDTPLGKSFRSFLAADKIRAMKTCSKETNPEKQRAAQVDYAAVCKLEIIFASILTDGDEAIQQLNQMQEGDTDEQR